MVSGSASSHSKPAWGGRSLGAASNRATSIRSARSLFQNAIAMRLTSRASISLSGSTLGHQAGGQFLQLGGGLVLQHEVLQGGEAVLERVAGAAGLAFGGDGAARAGAVAAGGLDLGGAAGAWGGGGHGWASGLELLQPSMKRRKFLDRLGALSELRHRANDPLVAGPAGWLSAISEPAFRNRSSRL